MALFAVSCAHHAKVHIPDKKGPEWTGVDPRLQPYVDEYLKLAQKRGIVFNHKVSMGIKKIGHEPVIGLCWTENTWREVDIDEDYFYDDFTSESQDMILVFHELTHCYCGRPHDYYANPGGSYGLGFISQLFNIPMPGPWRAKIKPGYFADRCGMSIMTPAIANQECIKAHIAHYIDEMFEGCRPY